MWIIILFAIEYKIGNVVCTYDETNPTRLFVKQGGEALLNCSFGSDALMWQVYNGSWIIIANKGATIDSTKYITIQNPEGLYVGLRILNVGTSDEKKYRCQKGINDPFYIQLELFATPLSLTLQDVTTDNKIIGTESQSLTLRCTASGGKPPPLVTITTVDVSISANQTVEYIIPTLMRRHDRQIVRCDANSSALSFPWMTNATLYLYLKPSQPTLSPDPISADEIKQLVVSCTSNGSRPQATFKWIIGLATITSVITTTSVYNTADDTYTVTSTLTYTVDRAYHGQTITCGAYNNVSNSGVNTSKTLEVKFTPDITVRNATFNQNTATRTVICVPVGNPTTYTYYRWQHKSTYGELIRELDGGQNGILTLPSVPVEVRYQDSGEYVCTASNGITGRDGKINQSGSGYIAVNDQPKFTRANKDTDTGEIGKDMVIHVYVYCFPKYTSVTWYKTNTRISQNDKYALSETAAIVSDTFYSTEVKLDGYRVTLTIKNSVESDFNVSYRVELSNGVGQPVIYSTLLVSTSPPKTPGNFTILSAAEFSIILQWEPGYNGGDEQTFYIEYHINGSNTWASVPIPDTKPSGKQIYTLSGLQDDTMYEVRMYAKNKYNKSLPTETVSIKTIKADSQASKQTGQIIGGVGGALASVVIILVVIWFVIFKRKKDPSTRSKSTRSDLDVPDGLKHKIPYQSAGSDFKPLYPKVESENTNTKPSTSETEYADVQRTVYAETVQQKNVQNKKQKAVNNNHGSEYTNSGISLKNMGEGIYANAEGRNGPPTCLKNQLGLEYADLSFVKQIPQTGKNPISHLGEERTLYSEVDHTKKAPATPQESAYEETYFKCG